MSVHTDDEFDFPQYTEDELRAIDSVADAAFASVPHIWPLSPSDPQTATSLELERSKEYAPHSRKSSGFSTVELTEEELRLIEESVARLESKDSQFSPATGSENALSTHSTYSRPAYIEVALESPVPSTLVASPAPTVGRSPNPSPSIMASLYSLFRSSRKSLSVSDLVGPIWCEVQFDYGLRGGRHLPVSQRPEVLQTRLGKEIQVQKNVAVENDRVLKKGTAIHKKLEQEIRPIEVEVTPQTREDIWGLKLLNMLSNIRILIDEGRCREMPVMGFVHGHFVIGVTDEIVLTPTSPPSPTFPGGFLRKGSSSPVESPTQSIHILDNKTRGVNSLPKTRDTLQSRMQLMLYKRLLDGLLIPELKSSSKARSETVRRLLFSDVWTHYSLDPSARFSSSFLEESAVLVTSNGLGPQAEKATCLQELEDVWNNTVNELAVCTNSGEQEAGIVSKTLKLVYRLRGASKMRYSSSSSKGKSRQQSPENSYEGNRRSKKVRAESEDLDLQRAIHASFSGPQDETSEIMREQRKDENQGLARGLEDSLRAPGGWVSHEDDLQRAIEEAKKCYNEETGKNVLRSSRDPKDRRESDEGIIGTVEFEYDDEVLDNHLNDVFDFWHDRRPPRGVAREDTGRCAHCEFSDGCEWLEAKANAFMQGVRSRKGR